MSENKRVKQVMVPIVGRPNVGKSTLFNRLIGQKRSITGSKPGVTRDRIVKTMNWGGKAVTLVDTAGFQLDHPSPVPGFIIKQVELMIEEGETIIFVVDAKEELTALDREIIQRLRPVSNRVIVAVNKVDPGRDLEVALSDHYRLGFKHLVPVSALHNRNMGELKEKIVELAPKQELIIDQPGINLALLGRPNVGKSTLFNSILGYERVMVSDRPGTTRDVVDVSFSVNEQRFILQDTVGIRRKTKISEELEEAAVIKSLRALDFCDIACLMLDWNSRLSKQDQRLAGLIFDRYRGCMVLVNKADDPEEEQKNRWVGYVRKRLHFLEYAPVLFTSGLFGVGLAEIFNKAQEIYREISCWFSEAELHNAFLDLKPKITWPSRRARPVIIRRIRQIGINPLSFELEARGPERLSAQDLRHFRKLLRKQLKLQFAPIKLKLVRKFSTDS